MDDRRLVGIDLGISSAHTVRVLRADGTIVCRRKAVPTVDSLVAVEQAALAGTAPATRLEVVIEPTGPAWLPIAVFFTSRGHTVYRVPGQLRQGGRPAPGAVAARQGRRRGASLRRSNGQVPIRDQHEGGIGNSAEPWAQWLRRRTCEQAVSSCRTDICTSTHTPSSVLTASSPTGAQGS